MKLYVYAATAIGAVLAVSPANAQRVGDRIPNSYICMFKNNVSRGDVAREARAAAEASGGKVQDIYDRAVRGFSVNISDQLAQRLKATNSNIAFCEQDQIMSIPPVRAEARPRRGGGGTTPQPGQETPWGIARVNGGGAGSFGTAWVIDTGVDVTHPDLTVDLARSRSFLSRDTSPVDQNGHGTHVAGTIAAKDNTVGVIGVAPGATIVAVRVLDRRGSGSNSGVIAGVNYVGANGRPGDVANMSLGGGISDALDQAVVSAAALSGVKFVLAAGNESNDANTHSPARANGPNVYTVSSIASGDNWSSFSNFGNPPIDYAEPGSSIKSTWIGGSYNTISGTSMAAPHLSGILLAGAPKTDGRTAKNDPDGKPDLIATR